HSVTPTAEQPRAVERGEDERPGGQEAGRVGARAAHLLSWLFRGRRSLRSGDLPPTPLPRVAAPAQKHHPEVDPGGDTCSGAAQCWNGASRGDDGRLRRLSQHWTNQSYASPQLCPLELQLGDALFAVPDRTLERYGVNLINVSREEFESCSTEKAQSQHFIFSGDMKGSVQVDPKWLSPGVHYFAATHRGSSQLCQLGLRVGVVVGEQHCQNSPLLRLCSGNGACRAKVGEFTYRCHCDKHYSGLYCEYFDACSEMPCLNGATCLSNSSASLNRLPYECLCPPQFTGVNCSEILGQRNCTRNCRNGACVEVSPASYQCRCFTGYTGE
uniref:Eyes shut homolog n=1 Tax=Astyanax mexicanus TaxID=7994 RepID=W5KPJ3_ASTMX